MSEHLPGEASKPVAARCPSPLRWRMSLWRRCPSRRYSGRDSAAACQIRAALEDINDNRQALQLQPVDLKRYQG